MSYTGKFGMTAALAMAAGAMGLSGPAQATLHGFCAGAGQCADNGINSPTSNNPPLNFGFTTSPGPTSGVDLWLDILVPNNEQTASSYMITGTLPGTATLFSATDWTSGQLDAYLGISASPANPIGAFLPSTQALDPSATGFSVYQADVGAATLQGPANPNVNPLENIAPGVPIGSYIVGFFNEGTAAAPSWQATANSGAIFETTPVTAIPEPATWALMAVGFAGLGFAGYRKSRRAISIV